MMPFDGLAIKALVQELNMQLFNARIDKIHQPEKDELIFTTRHPQAGTHRLVLSANPRWARLHITKAKKTNPISPPSFCMLLRKHLEGGKIKSIKQLDFERIVHIDIEALDEFKEWKTKRIICEFMGRHSNIIIVNPENNLILDAIKRFGSEANAYRELMPGKEYLEPPTQGKLNTLQLNYDSLVNKIWQQDLDQALFTALFNSCTGISTFAAAELCLGAGLDPDMPVHECGEYEFRAVFDSIQAILTKINLDTAAAVIYQDNKPVDFCPYSPARGEFRSFSSINQACDIYYTSKLELLRLESIKTNLSRNIKSILDKAYKKQFFQEGDLTKARESEKYRIWGELITAYAYKFEKGETRIVLNDFQSGEELSIDLDPRYTPIQNAQKYFKMYNKSRKAIKHLEKLMAKNLEEIEYLESVLLAIQQAESTADTSEIVEELEIEKYLKSSVKKRGKEKDRAIRSNPRMFVSSEGFEILVGRNNRQNDSLTMKLSDKGDLWLHTKNIPGSHVIIKLDTKIKSINDMPDTTLEEAALLAAYFSKARQSDKVEVDYTFRSNLKKPAGAKPGMVIYDNYWTIVINRNQDIINKLLKSQIKEAKNI